MKPKFFSTYGYNMSYEFDKEISIYIDVFNNIENDNSEYKFFISIEPQCISNNYNILKNKYQYFTNILTFDEEILNTIPNAVLFEYGTKWMTEDEYNSSTNKEYSVSFLGGNKIMTNNHRIRYNLWKKQDLITIPKKFYNSTFQGKIDDKSDLFLGDRKIELFNSMYHICIENNSSKYYFSEKLIDCLLMKSIPIYIGCSNIEDYFNTKTILDVKNEDEIIKICNELTSEFYNDNINSIMENYEKALLWIDYDVRLYEKINELL